MTNLFNLELTEMNVAELREIVKEYKMVGAWKAKKQEMIDFLEDKKTEQAQKDDVKENEEADEVEVVKISTPNKQVKSVKENLKSKVVILLDAEDNLIEEFKNQSEAIKYCMKENIANSGWIRRSIKTGERFYMPNGKKSKSQKSKYSGIGYLAVSKEVSLEEDAQ